MAHFAHVPDSGLYFGLLGPLAVWRDGRPVDAGSPQQQELLALLLLQQSQPISTDVIVDSIWGEEVPPNALQTIRTYVSRLRRIVKGDSNVAIVNESGGYRLSIANDRIDRGQFLVLAAAARTALLGGDGRRAENQLRDALALFRGRPMAGLDHAEFAHEEAGRLAELRLLAEEDLIEALLAQGAHRDALPRLRELVAREPYRERFAAQLMLALYRSARQVEALSVYRRTAARLREDLGIDPGRELQYLERMILLQERTLDHGMVGRLHGVPRYSGAFVGRRDAVADIRRLLRQSSMATIVGPAGVGKTRLAAEVAVQLRRRHPEGVWWISLEAVQPSEVVSTIGRRLGIRDSAPRSLVDLIVARLQGERALLLLDNCEHAGFELEAFLARLLGSASAVRVLATSREPVGIKAEQVYPLPPFEVPDASLPGSQLLESVAVGLLVSRARAAGAAARFGPDDASSLREVIDRLDGLPLAIELAAGKLVAMSAHELARSLRGGLTLLRADDPTVVIRHRTLDAAIAWSYDSLPPAEQRALRLLSAFPGSFDLTAALSVAGDVEDSSRDKLLPTITQLVRKSLVVADVEEATRYRLLAVVRTFGKHRAVQHREMAGALGRHRRHYTRVAEHLAGHMLDQALGEWLRIGSREHDNLRSALRNAMSEGDGEAALRLASALAPFWFRVGHVRDGLALLDRALETASPQSQWRPRGLLGRAWLADAAGAPHALDAALSALTAAEPGSAGQGFALAQVAQHEIRAGALAGASGRLAEARGIFERLGQAEGIALVEQLSGSAALERGDVDRAISHLNASRDRYRALRGTLDAGWTLVLLAQAALRMGDLQGAEAAASASVHDFRIRGDQRGVVASLACLGRVRIAGGDSAHAHTLLSEAVRLSETSGYAVEGAEAHRALATLDSAPTRV